MPLSQYIRRRRLTVAGAEVLAGERTLLEIAVRYGYGSGEAFARAFRAVHGVGPGEARRTGAALSPQPRMTFRLIIDGSSSMRYRVVYKPKFKVSGPTRSATASGAAAAAAGPQLSISRSTSGWWNGASTG